MVGATWWAVSGGWYMVGSEWWVLHGGQVTVVVIVSTCAILLWSLLPCSLQENEGSKRRKIEEGDSSL